MVFLDCPPSMSLVSENVLHAADILIVPLIPTMLCMRTLDQLTGFVAVRWPPAGRGASSPWSTGVSGCTATSSSTRHERSDVAATIPALSLIEQMAVHRAPVPAFAPNSAAGRAYRALWAEICPAGAVVSRLQACRRARCPARNPHLRAAVLSAALR